MMIDLCNKLVDNDLNKNDLLERIEIQKTCQGDIEAICNTLAKAFDMYSAEEAFQQLILSKARLDESIKLVDKYTGDIYGLLMFCEYPIAIGSPLKHINIDMADYLGQYSQVNGHSFIIDERLRGTGLDRKMLFHNIEFLIENYDFIWIAVEKSLKSLPYWHRLGFVDIFIIEEATFLMLPLSKKIINDIMYNDGKRKVDN